MGCKHARCAMWTHRRYLVLSERGVRQGNEHRQPSRGHGPRARQTIVELAYTNSELTFEQRPVDDPEMRCPEISLAQREVGRQPRVDLSECLIATIAWAREAWAPPPHQA
jgi:dTDP-glucose 4,6-dehydratase